MKNVIVVVVRSLFVFLVSILYYLFFLLDSVLFLPFGMIGVCITKDSEKVLNYWFEHVSKPIATIYNEVLWFKW